MPKKFVIDDVRELHPIKHEESLNSVLHQELMRYNNLIDVVYNSMKNLIDAINGDAVMTAELEVILLNVYDNKTPALIEKVSYPSLKPFGSWINDHGFIMWDSRLGCPVSGKMPNPQVEEVI